MPNTSSFQWLPGFLSEFSSAGVRVLNDDRQHLAPAVLLEVPSAEWSRVAQIAARAGLRWAGVWASERQGQQRMNVCLSRDGDYLIVRAVLPAASLASHAPHYPAAARMERHIRDLWGINWIDHPDPRRWTRHQAWAENQAPLTADFPIAGRVDAETPPDHDYPFLQAQGSGVHEIPVGPVHAGIIEPGHFRFQAAGETILHLEERLGYTHKGIEKIAVGRDAYGLLRLAGRISGDCTVGHAWAACMAMERAAGITPPPRALRLRAVLAERERIANHLGDVAAICNDVGFSFAFYQFMRLRELWLRGNAQYFGHRLLMDCLVPGGVGVDVTTDAVTELSRQRHALRDELRELLPLLADNGSLQDRLQGTGILTKESAEQLGCLGYVGRASGIDHDVRRAHRYAPYEQFTVQGVVAERGDVAARLQVRLDELDTTLDLLDRLLDHLPDGALQTPWQAPVAEAEGIGMVESWRGEILTYVRFDDTGHVARFFPRDPSWFTWPALEQLIRGNIVPEFPVCNKSVNASYSGQDL
jgi:Ni,Fe-hydrogenase III large subunit/Ni,Fe-hydrogenase III component G